MLDRTAVMPVVGRHRASWWRRHRFEVVLVALLGPLGLAGGWMVGELSHPENAGYVPYASSLGVPVAVGPAHPTMSVAANTARPVSPSKATPPTGRYSPTYRPVVAVTAAVTPRFLPATTKASATATPSRGPTPSTTAAPTPSPSPTSAPRPTPDPATTATPGPPAPPGP